MKTEAHVLSSEKLVIGGLESLLQAFMDNFSHLVGINPGWYYPEEPEFHSAQELELYVYFPEPKQQSSCIELLQQAMGFPEAAVLNQGYLYFQAHLQAPRLDAHFMKLNLNVIYPMILNYQLRDKYRLNLMVEPVVALKNLQTWYQDPTLVYDLKKQQFQDQLVSYNKVYRKRPAPDSMIFPLISDLPELIAILERLWDSDEVISYFYQAYDHIDPDLILRYDWIFSSTTQRFQSLYINWLWQLMLVYI